MARQILLLQALVVVLVAAALSLAAYDARRDAGGRDRPRRGRGPGGRRLPHRRRRAGRRGPVGDPPAVRRAGPRRHRGRLRRGDGLDRTRYTHPDPDQIGEQFIGDLGGAPRGRGLHPGVHRHARAVDAGGRARVVDDDRVVALVSVGITVSTIDRLLRATSCRSCSRRSPCSPWPGSARGWSTAGCAARPTGWASGRSPGCTSTTARSCTPSARGCCCSTTRAGPARQRRGATPAAPARRRARSSGARPRPAARPGRGRAGPDRRVRRHLRRGRPGPGRQLRARVLAGPGGRLGRHAARPHRAAVGDRRARRRPGAHRVPPLPEPRGRQPAAHGRLPHRDGPPRGGRRLRHRGAPGRPAAHRPGGRRGRRPGRRRCSSARPRRPRSAGSTSTITGDLPPRPDVARATWSRSSATSSTTPRRGGPARRPRGWRSARGRPDARARRGLRQRSGAHRRRGRARPGARLDHARLRERRRRPRGRARPGGAGRPAVRRRRPDRLTPSSAAPSSP